MKDTSPSIPKCPHGIFSPDGPGKPAKYCSFCTEPPVISEEDKLKILGKYTPWPHGKEVCPICGSKDVVYENDYAFECENCGFDALTN